jgi:hypothetical protein
MPIKEGWPEPKEIPAIYEKHGLLGVRTYLRKHVNGHSCACIAYAIAVESHPELARHVTNAIEIQHILGVDDSEWYGLTNGFDGDPMITEKRAKAEELDMKTYERFHQYGLACWNELKKKGMTTNVTWR